MPSSLAEYRMISPAGPLAARAWVADPPPRLGVDGPVVVIEVPAVDDDAWPAVRARLAEVAGIRSPHLPRLLESGRGAGEEPAAWLARDHAQARPLTLTGDDRLRPLRALAAAARGAHDLHEAGWAHGDIRPETILAEGHDALLDLPVMAASVVAPVVGRVGDPTALDGFEPDRLWGTGPTRASDVYALGAVLHRLLTGHALHPDLRADQPVTAVQRVLVERPRLDPALSGKTGQLVQACLDPNPARRPATALELAERLDELAAA